MLFYRGLNYCIFIGKVQKYQGILSINTVSYSKRYEINHK